MNIPEPNKNNATYVTNTIYLPTSSQYSLSSKYHKNPPANAHNNPQQIMRLEHLHYRLQINYIYIYSSNHTICNVDSQQVYIYYIILCTKANNTVIDVAFKMPPHENIHLQQWFYFLIEIKIKYHLQKNRIDINIRAMMDQLRKIQFPYSQ